MYHAGEREAKCRRDCGVIAVNCLKAYLDNRINDALDVLFFPSLRRFTFPAQLSSQTDERNVNKSVLYTKDKP